MSAVFEGRLRVDAMKLIYVAGPYRGRTPWAIEQNVRRAEELALTVCAMGAVGVAPHCMWRYYQGQFQDEYWLEAGLEVMRRCDAVALVDGWETSSGTKAEIDRARLYGMPVFGHLEDLSDWLRDSTGNWRAVG